MAYYERMDEAVRYGPVWYEMRFFSVENQNSPLFFI